ncbi:MAG: DNA ligase [Proteobacteria bacterium]|nr:DNA ligase [Pseudomonadota bacterium]MBU1737218.1 DNA ligase [Pseudomonadota bacterium]
MNNLNDTSRLDGLYVLDCCRIRRATLLLIPLLAIFLSGTAAAALELMLPQVYEQNIDVAGWLVSEKLDGVRGYWDGKRLLSKNGIPLNPPAEFLKNFPDFALEGEIWGGRGTFEKTVGIVKKQQPHSGWLDLKFAVFDVPEADAPFVQRLQKGAEWFAEHPSGYVFLIAQKSVKSKEDLKEELFKVESVGGEGLIVRRPDTFYRMGRSSDILKVKSYQDMEGEVVAHLPGTGRNRERLGALLVELPNGTRCKIGTGFTDEERVHPPQVGTTITFKYYGFYKSGLPKFPSYLRVREEGL